MPTCRRIRRGSTPPRPLQRRVHWLAGDQKLLAQDYAAQFAEAEQGQRNMALEDLVQEVDNKLLTGIQLGDIQTPLLLAVADLVQMRAHDPSTPRSFTWETLQAQQASFAAHPELFAYLQAAYRFYVDQDPAKTLEALPQRSAASTTSASASRPCAGWRWSNRRTGKPPRRSGWNCCRRPRSRTRRASCSWPWRSTTSAAASWKGLRRRFAGPGAAAAASSCATSPTPRCCAARPSRARRRKSATARCSLSFTGPAPQPLRRLRQGLRAARRNPSQTKLGTSLGYVYGAGNSLELFRWKGDKAESGYVCPAIAESAAALAADDKDPKGLNCLGEFILRNGLDGMPLDSQPEANELGGTPSGFKGAVYSRLDGYRLVMDNPKAPREDKAYALFRAINCFAPAGYNTCGQQDIPQAERKQWFRTLKSTYADSSWAKELKYYW